VAKPQITVRRCFGAQFKDNEVVFDMANGCVCCTVRGDLIEIFKKLRRRKDRFDRIIVETTGMADPAPVCQTFFVDQGVRSFAKIDAGAILARPAPLLRAPKGGITITVEPASVQHHQCVTGRMTA
jgi:G3E family GTPase